MNTENHQSTITLVFHFRCAVAEGCQSGGCESVPEPLLPCGHTRPSIPQCLDAEHASPVVEDARRGVLQPRAASQERLWHGHRVTVSRRQLTDDETQTLLAIYRSYQYERMVHLNRFYGKLGLPMWFKSNMITNNRTNTLKLESFSYINTEYFKCFLLKERFTQINKNLLFTLPHVIPSLYDRLGFCKKQNKIFWRILVNLWMKKKQKQTFLLNLAWLEGTFQLFGWTVLYKMAQQYKYCLVHKFLSFLSEISGT